MTGLLVFLTTLFGWNLQFLQFDFEFEKFFPKDHPDSATYLEHVEDFGYDNDYMSIILENDEGVFEQEFLQMASEVGRELGKIDGVSNVYSPLALPHVVKSPTGLVIFPLIHLDDPSRFKQDSIRIYENEFYRTGFSDNAKALNIYLNHEHLDHPEDNNELLLKIENLVNSYSFDKVRLVGKLSASLVFIRYIQNDFGKYLFGSFILSFGLLWLIFRNLKFAILPFVISLLSLVWTFGLMSLFGYKINLLSSLLPPIIFFVSMSDTVHLLNGLTKDQSDSRRERIKRTLQNVWTPTLLTSITTAIGFLSLFWINTEPVQVLGLFAAIGIMVAFVITFTSGVLISLLTNFRGTVNRIALRGKLFERKGSVRNQIVLIVLILILASIPGIYQLKINAFLLADLPEESTIRQDFTFSDKVLGGSKPFEVKVEVKDSSNQIWDKVLMDEILKIENYLINQYPVSKLQSPATIIKYLTMVNNGGLNEFYNYPSSDKDYNATLRLKRRIDPKRMNKLVTEDGKTARLIGFIPQIGSNEAQERNDKLLQYLNDNIDGQLISYNITGTTYLIDKSHELLSKNLIYGLLTAIIVIGVVLGIYFRSWKLLLISLIPNLIPLIIIAGIMGWFQISLNMTTAVIFTIVFGIAVDDTIHLMSHYLRNTNKDPGQRLYETIQHAGSAMLITSLVMIVGFILFLFSNFGATYYLGLFISISLAIALFIDLTLLPVLLLYVSKKEH